MINYVFLNIGILFLLFCSCEGPGDCITRTGKIVTVERETKPFHSIVLDEDINLMLHQNSNYTISIEAGEQLLNEITSNVVDSTLHLRNQNLCKWARSYQYQITVDVHLPDLKRIDYFGSGTITNTDTLDLNSIILVVSSGTGEVNLKLDADNILLYFPSSTSEVFLSGVTDYLEVYTIAKGFIDTRSLYCNHAKISSASTNNNYFHVSNQIEIECFGPGIVYYPEGIQPIYLNDEAKLYVATY